MPFISKVSHLLEQDLVTVESPRKGYTVGTGGLAVRTGPFLPLSPSPGATCLGHPFRWPQFPMLRACDVPGTREAACPGVPCLEVNSTQCR